MPILSQYADISALLKPWRALSGDAWRSRKSIIPDELLIFLQFPATLCMDFALPPKGYLWRYLDQVLCCG